MTPARRPKSFGVALFAAAALASACSAIPWLQYGTGGLHKLYIKDYTLNVSARLINGVSAKESEDAKIENIRSLGNIGLVYSPNYIFVADPKVLIASVTPLLIPADGATTEPMGFDKTGAETTEAVAAKPLYILNKTTLKYSVPGYTIPDVTITQETPIKSNDYPLTLGGVAQVNELMAAFQADPAKIGTLAGTVTVALDISDLDPFATERTFTVARSFPLVYAYLPFTPENTESPRPSPQPIIVPTVSVPTATPTAGGPSATPTPISTTLGSSMLRRCPGEVFQPSMKTWARGPLRKPEAFWAQAMFSATSQ